MHKKLLQGEFMGKEMEQENSNTDGKTREE
jgi:hypothetical protein